MTVTRRAIALRALAPIALALVAWLAIAAPAFAHAELEATTPGDGEAVVAPLDEVRARFSESLAGNSRIELLDPTGASVATGGIDPADDTQLVLAVPANARPGEYTVRWQASGADSHLERGTFTFNLAEPTPPPPTAAPSAVPSSAPSPTPPATLAPAPSPSVAGPSTPAASTTDVLIPIFAAVLALVALGAVLLRRRAARRA